MLLYARNIHRDLFISKKRKKRKKNHTQKNVIKREIYIAINSITTKNLGTFRNGGKTVLEGYVIYLTEDR